MLSRDINNMRRYYGQFAPEILHTHYAREIWSHYKDGSLSAETQLTGLYDGEDLEADVDGVLAEIKAVLKEEQERLERQREAEADD